MTTIKPLQNSALCVVMVGPEGMALSSEIKRLDNFIAPKNGTAICGIPPELSNSNGPAVLQDNEAAHRERTAI